MNPVIEPANLPSSADAEIVEAALRQIVETNGALLMFLQLLDSAHTEHLLGDHLHCLLQPIQAKLAQSIERLTAAM